MPPLEPPFAFSATLLAFAGFGAFATFDAFVGFDAFGAALLAFAGFDAFAGLAALAAFAGDFCVGFDFDFLALAMPRTLVRPRRSNNRPASSFARPPIVGAHGSAKVADP